MKPMERFSDLGRLLDQDDRFLRVAQYAVAALSAMRDDELAQLVISDQQREELFAEIWDEIVETASRTGDDSFRAWQMSMEGVVIDHVIRLWTAGERLWRDRTRALIPAAA